MNIANIRKNEVKVFVLIPVFNRLEHTKRVISALRAQTLSHALEIVIIDDGSSDATPEFLATQADITTLRGDGSLWWGGAIHAGLRTVLQRSRHEDYILFLNNDTWFGDDYVDTLVNASQSYHGAAVGSALYEGDISPTLVSIGPRININRIAVWDVLRELPMEEQQTPREFYSVDALSGRGTLYPASLFKRFGTMRPRVLPHYMADYEVAMRFKRNGVPLIVSTRAVVYSPPVYGNDMTGVSWRKRVFGKRSPDNIFQRTIFYCLVGSPLQRLTAPLRIAYFETARALVSRRSSN
jgi:GT2 family glycosyltransferase